MTSRHLDDLARRAEDMRAVLVIVGVALMIASPRISVWPLLVYIGLLVWLRLRL